jgi:hypothetical protein
MGDLSGLRYDNFEVGPGAAQLRLQQVRQFRARTARGGARYQMRAPIPLVIT